MECVEIVYDPAQITLEQLLNAFFAIIDPTSLNQQGDDIGIQYRTGIYMASADQEAIVHKVLYELQQHYHEQVVTEVRELTNFYPAESYHQDYLDHHVNRYCHINLGKAYACMKEMGIRLK